MFDITLRPLKDQIFDPLSRSIPKSISPLQITSVAFACGLLSWCFAYGGNVPLSLSFWALNRALDCLDGAVARHRGIATDLGGFLDLLGDFIVYAGIPIACYYAHPSTLPEARFRGLCVAVLEVSFFLNNFVLFFIAAVLEKRRANAKDEDEKGQKRVKELTSVAMRPALIEGAESGIIFTVMLAWPHGVEVLCWLMAVLVFIGTAQRVTWVIPVLGG